MTARAHWDRGHRPIVIVTSVAIAGLLSLASAAAQPSVTVQASAARTHPVTSGFVPTTTAFWDASAGLIGGTVKSKTGAIAVTLDGGQTWAVSLQSNKPVSEVVVAPGLTDAWAIAGRQLLHTADGGGTWQPLGRVGATRVSFASASDGWAIRSASAGVMLSDTNDGGATWTTVATPCRRRIAPLDISLATKTHGWLVCGGNGAAGSLSIKIFETTTGGAHWTRKSGGFQASPDGYQFLDDGSGWRWMTNSADLYGTTDGGATWKRLSAVVNKEAIPVSVWFTTSSVSYAVVYRGASSLVARSGDGGHTWKVVTTIPRSS